MKTKKNWNQYSLFLFFKFHCVPVIAVKKKNVAMLLADVYANHILWILLKRLKTLKLTPSKNKYMRLGIASLWGT